MILVVQRYTTGDDERDRELNHCRQENSQVFDRVISVNGNTRRWQFGELAGLCDEYRGTVCCIANSDIAFDWSLRHAEQVLTQCELICLTRWESEQCPRMIGYHHGDSLFSGSQDAWIFRAGTLPPVKDEINLGHVGCDQRIAGWAVQNNLRIANPCLTIRSRHYHSCEQRPNRPIDLGFYAYPEVSTAAVSTLALCHDWYGKTWDNLRVMRAGKDGKYETALVCNKSP